MCLCVKKKKKIAFNFKQLYAENVKWAICIWHLQAERYPFALPNQNFVNYTCALRLFSFLFSFIYSLGDEGIIPEDMASLLKASMGL